eukprot:4174415-Pleurochrysis_carterae.AAC.1
MCSLLPQAAASIGSLHGTEHDAPHRQRCLRYLPCIGGVGHEAKPIEWKLLYGTRPWLWRKKVPHSHYGWAGFSRSCGEGNP